MAPTWRLTLVLSLLLFVGALAKHSSSHSEVHKKIKKTKVKTVNKTVHGLPDRLPDGIPDAIPDGINKLYGKGFEDLVKHAKKLNPQSGCYPELIKAAAGCVITVAKDFPEFKKMVAELQGLDGAQKRAKRMTGNATAKPKDTKADSKKDSKAKKKEPDSKPVLDVKPDITKDCKPTYAFALCLSHHLCMSTHCNAIWTDAFIVKGKAFLKPLFAEQCKGSGNVDALGCKDVSRFRKLDQACDKTIADQVADCKKKAIGKVVAKDKDKDQDAAKGCHQASSLLSCIVQAKCDECDRIVVDVSETVAQTTLDAHYMANCPSLKPGSVKCSAAGAIVGAILGVIFLLCLVGGICFCCYKSRARGQVTQSTTTSMAKGKSQPKMQGPAKGPSQTKMQSQSKMAGKSKA